MFITNGISIAYIEPLFNHKRNSRFYQNAKENEEWSVYMKKFILVTIFSAVFLTLPASIAFYIIFDSLPVFVFNDIGLIAN